MGRELPLRFAAAAPSGKESGRLVGGVYAANTLGAIVGALGVSLVLVPWIGTQQTQRLLVLLSWSARPRFWRHTRAGYRSQAVALGLTVSLVVAGLLAWRVQKIPGELIAYGRRVQTAWTAPTFSTPPKGRNSSVAISIGQDGSLEVDVNGHVEATTEPFDMKLQRMVGHLPALLHPNPKSVLGIGFGAGVSAGTFTRYPGIQKITVCEIEPVIPPTSTQYFGQENYA